MDRIYAVDGKYDIDLKTSGDGWTGTFEKVVRQAIEDITIEGAWSPCEITYDGGEVVTGTLYGYGSGDDIVKIEGLALELDRVTRFRA